MRDGGPLYFFDTVSLSNFALAGRIDLLVSRYGARAQLTEEVRDEITDGIVAGHFALRLIEEAISANHFSAATPMSVSERNTYREILRVLSPGEASCIACARARKGVVVTDDRAARECCASIDIPFTGTTGILVACCRDQSLLSEAADAILQTMTAAGYYAPINRISDLV
ncbi:MAG: hypothetical protein HQ523_02655 [Lentisphaerae bacterium]|nr:hypothetical protein [Lentisphaerota bacterium]